MERKHERGAAHFGEFADAITSLARKVLEDVGDEQMKRIFIDCVSAHHDPERSTKSMKDKKLRKIRELLIETPLPYIKTDVEEAFADLNIDEKFQLLLELRDKYKQRRTAGWRPPPEPHQHMAALRVASKRELLGNLQIIVSMKRHQVDHLKEQFKNKKAAYDGSRAAAEIDDAKRKLEITKNLNARFNETRERVVEQITQEIVKNSWM